MWHLSSAQVPGIFCVYLEELGDVYVAPDLVKDNAGFKINQSAEKRRSTVSTSRLGELITTGEENWFH